MLNTYRRAVRAYPARPRKAQISERALDSSHDDAGTGFKGAVERPLARWVRFL
jgi:hypothetical protein